MGNYKKMFWNLNCVPIYWDPHRGPIGDELESPMRPMAHKTTVRALLFAIPPRSTDAGAPRREH